MASSSSPSKSTTVDQCSGESISAVPDDIIETHVLTNLDGPTLATAACVSSQFHALCTDEKLWRDICTTTWPSINHPRVAEVISSFPAGYRSFFSDSFPFLSCKQSTWDFDSLMTTTPLISAVDIYYKGKIIYSRIRETKTVTGWFQCSPLRVNLLDQEESGPAGMSHGGQNNSWMRHLEENLTLSWILIDPIRKRAVNISSRRAVLAKCTRWTGNLVLKYATIIGKDEGRGTPSLTEFVECEVLVTCQGKGGGEVNVSEVSMTVRNMKGESLSVKESFVIFQGAMEGGNRRKKDEVKERYEEFMEAKRIRKEKLRKIERAFNRACFFVVAPFFLGTCSLIFCR